MLFCSCQSTRALFNSACRLGTSGSLLAGYSQLSLTAFVWSTVGLTILLPTHPSLYPYLPLSLSDPQPLRRQRYLQSQKEPGDCWRSDALRPCFPGGCCSHCWSVPRPPLTPHPLHFIGLSLLDFATFRNFFGLNQDFTYILEFCFFYWILRELSQKSKKERCKKLQFW